jgi:hypothetical protein
MLESQTIPCRKTILTPMRESGASSTPRLLDSITGFSGILGRPVIPDQVEDRRRAMTERVGRIRA